MAAPPLQHALDAEDLDAAFAVVHGRLCAAYSELDAARRLPYFVQLGPGTIDYPGAHLLRLWVLRPDPAPTNCLARMGRAEDAARLVPPGLAFLPRQAEDDPNVVGVWM